MICSSQILRNSITQALHNIVIIHSTYDVKEIWRKTGFEKLLFSAYCYITNIFTGLTVSPFVAVELVSSAYPYSYALL